MSRCAREQPAFRRPGAVGSSALLLLAMAFGGCTEEAPPPPASDVVPELQLAALPLIGSVAGDGADVFGDIVDVEIGEDGSVFVLDGANAEIRVFDKVGTHLRTMGGSGSGPGELRNPEALTWGPGGNLWVADPGNARFTVYASDGRLIGSHRRGTPTIWYPWSVGFSSEGLLYEVTFVGDDGGFLEVGQLIEYEVVEAELVELQRSRLPPLEQGTFTAEGGGMVSIQPIPFGSRPLSHIGSDGQLWYARTGEPWVYRRPPFGGQELRFGRQFEAPVVTPVEREAALQDEVYERLIAEFGRETFQELASLIPERKPHLQEFFFDDESNVWIMQTPGQSGENASPIDIYDVDGNLIAVTEIMLEPEVWPRVRNGLVAGVVRDELEVPFVALYEISL